MAPSGAAVFRRSPLVPVGHKCTQWNPAHSGLSHPGSIALLERSCSTAQFSGRLLRRLQAGKRCAMRLSLQTEGCTAVAPQELSEFPALMGGGTGHLHSSEKEKKVQLSRVHFSCRPAVVSGKGAGKRDMRVYYRPHGMPAAPICQEEIENNDVMEEQESVAPSSEESASSSTSGDKQRQPRKVKSSSAWWKKNFSTAAKELRSKSEDSQKNPLNSTGDREPESGGSELSSSAGVPVDKGLAMTGDNEEQAEALVQLVKKRKRGPRGRVVVQHGKDRSSSDFSGEGLGPCFSGREEAEAEDRRAWFPHSGVFEIEGKKVDTATVKRALEAQVNIPSTLML